MVSRRAPAATESTPAAAAATAPAPTKRVARSASRPAPTGWVPARQDIVWIDCNPQAGAEMRDLHPLLVLSPQAFNAKTGRVIGLPMTTAAYNATNPFAISVGPVVKGGRGRASYVLCHQPKSFDWRARGARPHPLKALSSPLFDQACDTLNQIIALG